MAEKHPITTITRRTAVQSGIVWKPQPGFMTIRFEEEFAVTPVVVISPYLQFTDQQVHVVPEVETINDINKEEFTISSNIGNADYYVSWIAIGHGEDPGKP